MYQFTGCPCSVCGKTLTDTDDIVVCPDCGAPYHRACYEKQGACVYAARHGTGFEWMPPASAWIFPSENWQYKGRTHASPDVCGLHS